MRLGYITNGFASHRFADAIDVLFEIGYRDVGVTLESELLDPPSLSGVHRAAELICKAVGPRPIRLTIETGSRFILDPRKKHHPTLVSSKLDGRRKRIDFLLAAIDLAQAVNAECVSLWSGSSDDGAGYGELFYRLTSSLERVLARAEASRVRLALEPEPGMYIDTMHQFERLHGEINHPLFGLTLDVGHVHCLNDGAVREHLHRWRGKLWNVHVEDMKRGVHEHLMFGEGEMNFSEVFASLHEIDYAGPVHVELSRHSHDAVNTARRSFEFLAPFFSRAENPKSASQRAST